MPDLSSPQTGIKPYENRPRCLSNNLFLPTLKPKEPLNKHADNRRVVMFVEEAQGMPIATLEELRLLSNLETARDKLLQIVLFGQPELDHKLSAH